MRSSRFTRLVRRSALALPLFASPAAAQAVPKTGQEVLERMKKAYDGKWYHALTFVQKTTVTKPDGSTAVQTWYETLRHSAANGTRLRIDVGQPREGNGMLFTADSTYVMRAAKLVARRGEGNEFLPLIEGVYVQPVEQTVRELAPTRVDLSKVRANTWKGRAVWAVGAKTDADSLAPQFWVDVDRLVVVRMVLKPTLSAPVLDIRLDGYEKAGKGWLATKITMLQGGKPLQTEEYSSWKVDSAVDARLLDVATWGAATHWVKP